MTFKDAAAVAAAAAAGGAGGEAELLSSEYESIDPSIFGRVKAKIRRSQVTMRRRAALSSDIEVSRMLDCSRGGS